MHLCHWNRGTKVNFLGEKGNKYTIGEKST